MPVSSTRMSPGTSSSAEISCNRPSRRTRTTGTAICLREAIARSARYSEANPSTPNRTTIAPMAIVSMPLPSNPETTAATIRIRTIVCVNCSSSMRKGPLPACSCNSLGPYCRKRDVTSAAVRPFSDVDSAASTSSFDLVCQSFFAIDILQDSLHEGPRTFPAASPPARTSRRVLLRPCPSRRFCSLSARAARVQQNRCIRFRFFCSHQSFTRRVPIW